MKEVFTITLALLFAATTARADTPATKMVVCSPGSPGTTAEAQPTMDALATALSTRSGTPVTIVYDPSEAGGVKRLRDAGIGMVSLPFFLAHEQELSLHARLVVVQKGRPALDTWALVAQKGRITSADKLAGFTITSTSAFAPVFIRNVVLGGFGALPADAKLKQSTAILSALRRAADGAPSAVVLDGAQQASLASLPFAAKLDTVARSPALPAGLIVTIDAKLPDAAWKPLARAFEGLAADKAGAGMLAGMQVDHFAALDEKALAAARAAYAGKR